MLLSSAKEPPCPEPSGALNPLASCSPTSPKRDGPTLGLCLLSCFVAVVRLAVCVSFELLKQD